MEKLNGSRQREASPGNLTFLMESSIGNADHLADEHHPIIDPSQLEQNELVTQTGISGLVCLIFRNHPSGVPNVRAAEPVLGDGMRLVPNPSAAMPLSRSVPTLIAGIVVAGFVVAAVAAPSHAASAMAVARDVVMVRFGWFYLLLCTAAVLVMLLLACGQVGRVRLGPKDCEPDYSYGAWLAMLSTAALGVGLIFYGVADPVLFYAQPLYGDPRTPAAAQRAMTLAWFHWGLHGWSVYAVVGLAIAYAAHRFDLPLSIRVGLYPLLGKRIHGVAGISVDALAMCSVIVAIATSMGLGVLQLTAGLKRDFAVPEDGGSYLLIAAILVAVAVSLCALRIAPAVTRLSQSNTVAAFLLMALVVLLGPTQTLLDAVPANLGNYLDGFIPYSLATDIYGARDPAGDWTLFYWGGWIAWSPFVGMFIAQTSRGRTVREFVGGMLIVPVLFTFLWLTALGNAAIALDRGAATGALSRRIDGIDSGALFHLLGILPGRGLLMAIGTALLVSVFVTTMNSGAAVLDGIARPDADDAPSPRAKYWCAMIGLVVLAVVPATGIATLQAAMVVVSLPFAIVLLGLMLALLAAMYADPG